MCYWRTDVRREPSGACTHGPSSAEQEYGGESPEKFESRATRGGGARTTCGHGARDLFPPHDLRFAHDLLSLAHDVLP